MSILVAYSGKHGATREIAERMEEKLREAGQDADARPGFVMLTVLHETDGRPARTTDVEVPKRLGPTSLGNLRKGTVDQRLAKYGGGPLTRTGAQ